MVAVGKRPKDDVRKPSVVFVHNRHSVCDRVRESSSHRENKAVSSDTLWHVNSSGVHRTAYGAAEDQGNTRRMPPKIATEAWKGSKR